MNDLLNKDEWLALAAQLRDAKVFGRSFNLNQLFDLLIEAAVEGRTFREIEIACLLFGESKGPAAVQDATVRVYVHRLRQKLDQYYATQAPQAPRRLYMPKGEYRLSILETAAIPVEETPAEIRRPSLSFRATLWGVGILAALGLLVLILTRAPTPDAGMAAIRSSSFWGPTIASGNSVIVLGDYYIFGELDGSGQVHRLVREFSVNSRYDLAEMFMEKPELVEKYVDLGLRYYPIGVARALRDILPVVQFGTTDEARPRIISASNLSPGMIRTRNLIYVGYLSGLGALRTPVFNGSRLKIGSSYDELTDSKTGRLYAMSINRSEDGQTHEEYAYLSRFAGPSGTNIIVIAGTRDAALMQAADFVSHKANLEEVERQVGGAKAFEALLRVETLGDENVSGKLVFASPLAADKIWGASTKEGFPDDDMGMRSSNR